MMNEFVSALALKINLRQAYGTAYSGVDGTTTSKMGSTVSTKLTNTSIAFFPISVSRIFPSLLLVSFSLSSSLKCSSCLWKNFITAALPKSFSKSARSSGGKSSGFSDLVISFARAIAS